MRRMPFHLLSSILTIFALDRTLRPEKHPVKDLPPLKDGTGYRHGPARRFYRRVGKQSWFQHRTHKNRIARLSRRRNRGNQGKNEAMNPLHKRAGLDGLQVLIWLIAWMVLFTWARCGFC